MVTRLQRYAGVDLVLLVLVRCMGFGVVALMTNGILRPPFWARMGDRMWIAVVVLFLLSRGDRLPNVLP
jgi:hypothetical protein